MGEGVTRNEEVNLKHILLLESGYIQLFKIKYTYFLNF